VGYPHSNKRTRRRKFQSARFQYWGSLLFVVSVLLGITQEWREFFITAFLWLLYMLTVRLARCRVETKMRQPCRWRVRGFFGTCEYHVGDKWTMPALCVPPGRLLPSLIWRRHHSDASFYHAPPQAGGASAISDRAQQPVFQTLAVVIAGAGLLVAAASFVRDVVAG
jgi:hypothetical protein